PAALAWTETRALGVGAGGVERHVRASWLARRAGRSAIDAGRAHGIDEVAVDLAIAPLDRPPARVVGQPSRHWPHCFVVAHHQTRHCHCHAQSGADGPVRLLTGNLWIEGPQALRSLLSNPR